MNPSAPASSRSRTFWIRWLLLPIMLAAAILALVAETEKEEVEIAIAVNFTHLADDLLLRDGARHTVRLLVAAPAATLEQIDMGTATCQMNLDGLGPGSHTLTVAPESVTLPPGLGLKRLLTPSLKVQLEPLAEKRVAVIPLIEGSAAPGFSVATVGLDPSQVVLRGTAEALAAISTVRTHPIELDGASDSFKKEVPLQLPDDVATAAPLSIVVAQVEIGERIVTRQVNQVPVSVNGRKDRYRIRPETISLTVSGPAPVVNAIETTPEFAVTVDLSGLPTGEHTIKASIQLPVKTTLVAAQPETFVVTISP